jgi:hypothetical protein
VAWDLPTGRRTDLAGSISFTASGQIKRWRTASLNTDRRAMRDRRHPHSGRSLGGGRGCFLWARSLTRFLPTTRRCLEC